jgi:hypothetical protein
MRPPAGLDRCHPEAVRTALELAARRGLSPAVYNSPDQRAPGVRLA